MDLNRKDIILILDESGSMQSLGKEPEQAVNLFLSDQKKVNLEDSKLTFYKFNSKVTKVYNDEILSNIGLFDDYKPNGMTALFDAIGYAITEKEKLDNVTCLIITDGADNMSRDFDKIKIKNLICDMEIEYKWNFVYMGASKELFEESSDIGIKKFYSFENQDEDNLSLLPMVREISRTISIERSCET